MRDEKELTRVIGAMFRKERKWRGVSQHEMGDIIGVTFQQIQKYERGLNRISPAKLVIGLESINCDPVAFLKVALQTGNAGDVTDEVHESPDFDFFRAFAKLSPRVKKKIIALVKAIGEYEVDISPEG